MNDERNVKDDGLDPGATGAVRLMRDHHIEARTPATRARSFRTLGTRLGAMRERARKRKLAAIGVSCVAIAAAIGFGARSRVDVRAPSALTYTVNGGAPVPGGYILPAPAPAAPMLSFSDGTRIQMAAEARGRVVEIDRHGGRIALEDGKAHVQVAHRDGARWVFEAGPFLINVQGTAFSFGWNGRDARFELQMDSGVVSVTGPVSGGEIVLRAGQRLAIDLHEREAAARAVPAAPAETPPAADTPAAGRSPAQTAGSERWSPEAWAARLAEGRADLIVADARRIGLAKVLDRGSSEELAALASAARYQRDDALARRALLTQRHRFPRSMRAAEASFLLGRIDDESGDDTRRALDWYDRYLARSARRRVRLGGARPQDGGPAADRPAGASVRHRHRLSQAFSDRHVRPRGAGSRPRSMTGGQQACSARALIACGGLMFMLAAARPVHAVPGRVVLAATVRCQRRRPAMSDPDPGTSWSQVDSSSPRSISVRREIRCRWPRRCGASRAPWRPSGCLAIRRRGPPSCGSSTTSAATPRSDASRPPPTIPSASRRCWRSGPSRSCAPAR